MQRVLALAAVAVIALGGCSGAEEPPDYSDLADLADRLPAAVGTPPGVAAVDARGGSVGDGGYFEIEVLLAPGATGDEVVDLVQGRLPEAMARLDSSSGAPLVVRTADGDVLRPEWGPYADAVAEAVLIRAWVEAADRLSVPVTVDNAHVSVELGERPDAAVAATYRELTDLRALHGASTPDLYWTVTRTPGVLLRLTADHALPTAEQLDSWQGLVATTRQPAGPFRPLSLDAATWGTGLKCTYTLTAATTAATTAAPPVAADELTPERYGPVLLPVLAAQARLCARDAYEVLYATDPAAPPVALADEWRPAIRAAVRALRGSATLGR